MADDNIGAKIQLKAEEVEILEDDPQVNTGLGFNRYAGLDETMSWEDSTDMMVSEELLPSANLFRLEAQEELQHPLSLDHLSNMNNSADVDTEGEAVPPTTSVAKHHDRSPQTNPPPTDSLQAHQLMAKMSKLLDEKFRDSHGRANLLATELAVTQEKLREAETKIRRLNSQLEEREVQVIKLNAEKEFIHWSRVKDNEELRGLMIRIEDQCRKNREANDSQADEFIEMAAGIEVTLDRVTVAVDQLAAEQAKLQSQIDCIKVKSELSTADATFVGCSSRIATCDESSSVLLTTQGTSENLGDCETVRDREKSSEDSAGSPNDVVTAFESNQGVERRDSVHDAEGSKELAENIKALNEMVQQLLSRELVSTHSLHETLRDTFTSDEFAGAIEDLVTVGDLKFFGQHMPGLTYFNAIMSTVLTIDEFHESMSEVKTAVQGLLREATFTEASGKLLKSDSFHKKANAVLKSFNETSKTFLKTEDFESVAEKLLSTKTFETQMEKSVDKLLTTQVFASIAKKFLTRDAFLAFMGNLYNPRESQPPGASQDSTRPRSQSYRRRTWSDLSTPRSFSPADHQTTGTRSRVRDASPRLRVADSTSSSSSPAPSESEASSPRQSLFSSIFKNRQKRTAYAVVEVGDEADEEGTMAKRRRMLDEAR
ncbi:hypothetical protein PVAG01_08344 [Phlyctema vagabunda]|uniref:Uncharacterized protein n=1 Tax=Phlyctema vagabunda TaxID=108571 RepID=A0ABR4P950_9HELO